jgi:hypothetical protein
MYSIRKSICKENTIKIKEEKPEAFNLSLLSKLSNPSLTGSQTGKQFQFPEEIK